MQIRVQQEGKDVMQAFENSLEDSIYEEAAPKPHVFRVEPQRRARDNAEHAVKRTEIDEP